MSGIRGVTPEPLRKGGTSGAAGSEVESKRTWFRMPYSEHNDIRIQIRVNQPPVIISRLTRVVSRVPGDACGS